MHMLRTCEKVSVEVGIIYFGGELGLIGWGCWNWHAQLPVHAFLN